MESIQDIVGDTIPEENIIEVIKKSNYDVEKALDELLNRNKPSNPSKGKIFKVERFLELSLLNTSFVGPTEDRVNCVSSLYIALTTTSNNSTDFYHYDFRKYIKDYLLKSLLLYQNSIANRGPYFELIFSKLYDLTIFFLSDHSNTSKLGLPLIRTNRKYFKIFIQVYFIMYFIIFF